MQKKAINTVAVVSRLLLAFVFLVSGIVKAIDPLGTVYKIEDYLKAFGGFFTDLMTLATAAAFCLIGFECVLGVCLLCNIRTPITAWLTFIFYCVMTPLTLYIALNNPVSDCGCFGDAIVLTNWKTFSKNVVLILLAIVLLCTKRQLHNTFVWQAEIGIVIASGLMVAALMYWTLNHLPLADFRPYKIGNNLPALMEYPDDAEPDQYDISFVYEKDGVQQTFTIDNYPKGDTTWTFVRQDSRLIKKGYEPPIHDFEITNSDYEDITYDILESEVPVTLAVMYDLKKTDMKQADKLLALYKQCLNAEQPFYILTGSGTDDVNDFCAQQGMDELQPTICSCDPVTLKTIVRANPGIVVIRNGIVTDKYNLKNKN
jgi:uncharacterized membrane protein YphA (DoxX/SURF4 family)